MKLRKILASLLAVTVIGVSMPTFSTVVPKMSMTASAEDYQKDTEGFVTRMYNVVLNRNPDPIGLTNWTNKLNDHSASASDIIYGFFNSPEYKGKKNTNEQIITDCYNAMLDRDPDSTGKNTWLSRLDIGMTSMSVCKGFVGSNEFKNLCEKYGIIPGDIQITYARDDNYERTNFVYRLYKNCLGREPDIQGLENWCMKLKNGTTGTQIAEGFIFSKEIKSKHLLREDFVKMLYATLLGRGADQNGLKNWVEQLYMGKSKQSVTNGFIFSNEFKGQCTKAGIDLGNEIPTPEGKKPAVYPKGNYKQGVINGAYMTQNQLDQCAVVVSNFVENNIHPDMTDIEKVATIYKYFYSIPYSSDYANYSDRLYGPLINHIASCWGYASAFQYLCQAVEIECIYVIPVNWSNDLHRFNIVKVDGEYYVCDPQPSAWIEYGYQPVTPYDLKGDFLISEDMYQFSEEMKAMYPCCPRNYCDQ